MEPKSTQNNHIAISFISLKQSCYIESTGSGNILGAFLKIFKHSTKTGGVDYLVEGIQQNTPGLKLKINEFITKHSSAFPALNGFRTFLKELPENQYFLIVMGKNIDTSQIMEYFKFLTRYHNDRGIQQSIDEKAFDYGETFEHYNLHSYGHQRKRIGGNIAKENRICRYCETLNGKLNYFGSVVKFRGKSHAFPEALGNKNVIDLDECDACNERFGCGIEPSLINYVSVFRSLYGLKGKNGLKKLVGENFVLDPSKGFDIKYDGIIDPEAKIDNIKADLYLKDSFVPQDVYRCLVKSVLSLLDRKDMAPFVKTIDWVNRKFDAEFLPCVSFVQSASFYNEQPGLHYFQRKDDSCVPYMIGEFHYADMVFLFILPFCSLDHKDYKSEIECDTFWKEFNEVRSLHNWETKDFSSTAPVKIVINMDINGIYGY